MQKQKLFLVLIFCILSAGCGRNQSAIAELNTDNSGLAKARPVIRSEESLRHYLVRGMPTNDLVKLFGNPDWGQIVNDHNVPTLIWTFNLAPFPAGDAMKGTTVHAFLASITNGHLARWSCVYRSTALSNAAEREVPFANNATVANSSDKNRVTLKLFLLSPSVVPMGKYIDTSEYPRLGYIPSKPLMEIDKLRDVKLKGLAPGDSAPREWAFSIVLTPRDEAAAEAVTADNVGNRLLLMIGEKVICPVYITAPILSNTWDLNLRNKAVVELAKKEFSRISREPE